MRTRGLLDDETIEAIVAGDAVDARFDAVVAFVRGVRRLGERQVPRPAAALEAVFAGDPSPRHVAPIRRWRGRRMPVAVARVAGLGLVAKVALGTSLAAAGVVAAASGGALPDPATDGVRQAIEAVTPVDFPQDGGGDVTRPDGAPRFGERVSADATGASDGVAGVDGGDVSGEAPGASRRPGHAGSGAPAVSSPEPPGASSTVPSLPPAAGGDGASVGSGAPLDGPAPDAAGSAGPGRDGEVPSSTTPVVPSTSVPAPRTAVPEPGDGAAPLAGNGG